MSESNDAPPPAPEEQAAPPRPVQDRLIPVDECELVLAQVRLGCVECAPAGQSTEPQSSVTLECRGELEPKQEDNRFRATVSWAVPEGSLPLVIHGKHVMIFEHNAKLNSISAEYYARINSVILAYPYIRQTVDDLVVKTGQRLVVLPLDVPGFVRREQELWRRRASEESAAASKGNTDGQD